MKQVDAKAKSVLKEFQALVNDHVRIKTARIAVTLGMSPNSSTTMIIRRIRDVMQQGKRKPAATPALTRRRKAPRT